MADLAGVVAKGDRMPARLYVAECVWTEAFGLQSFDLIVVLP